MWNKSRLSKEILKIFGIVLLIAFACFWILNEVANRIVFSYIESEVLQITEYQLIDIQYWILGLSFFAGILLFLFLFLYLTAERLAYIKEIVKGIDALGNHDWEYEIPLHGQNELSDLARCINSFSKEEQVLQEKEKQLQEEKASLIRSLSHDIRTPLTSMMAYSEFLRQKETLTADEIKNYMELVEQKSQQIKVLTDCLLDGGNRQLEQFENGRFLMEQLLDECIFGLEDVYDCQVNLEKCPSFSGKFDVQELRRIFDNLASNIHKYADERFPICFSVEEKEGRICLVQSNVCKKLSTPVESTKIGLDSMKKIAAHYGGDIKVKQTEQDFLIAITLCKV